METYTLTFIVAKVKKGSNFVS